MTTFLSILALNILVQILKNKILPKFGSTGVHVFIFAISFIFIIAKTLVEGNPAWHQAFQTGLQYLVGAVAFYEIVIKKVLEKIDIPRLY